MPGAAPTGLTASTWNEARFSAIRKVPPRCFLCSRRTAPPSHSTPSGDPRRSPPPRQPRSARLPPPPAAPPLPRASARSERSGPPSIRSSTQPQVLLLRNTHRCRHHPSNPAVRAAVVSDDVEPLGGTNRSATPKPEARSVPDAVQVNHVPRRAPFVPETTTPEVDPLSLKRRPPPPPAPVARAPAAAWDATTPPRPQRRRHTAPVCTSTKMLSAARRVAKRWMVRPNSNSPSQSAAGQNPKRIGSARQRI